MKRIIVLTIALLIVVQLGLAGDDSKPISRSGSKAFLFTLNGLSNIGAGSFQGGVGAKYYISDGNAIRLGLGFSTSSTTTKYTGTPGPNFADMKQSSTGFSLSPAFLHMLNTNGPVLAYVGAQFTFGTSSSTTENPGFVNNNKIHDSSSMFLISALAGVEWFAWDFVSFAAEYQLGYSSSSGTHEVTTGGTTTTTDNPSTTGFGMGSVSGGNLTVAIFW